ncbi:MAG: aconitate hydratase [Spirochaetales bacterium]|nr:aconitate hydratase [Spirochaetales bacterium]
MGKTVTEKILESHIVKGKWETGREIGIKIDQTLTQDATGTMVYLQFETMNLKKVQTELSVSYVDHNTLQSDFRNMDDHLYLQTVAARFGIYFSRPGNGICHQVHLERFGIPGKTLLGSDSHTPTGSALGMIAIGAGGLDVAAAMAGLPFYLNTPEIIGVHLTGKLQPMCSAKDIILTVLKMETVKGGVGKIYEYYGEGVKTLSVEERATITNMGAELGATTSVFPSDDRTREFLKLQKREKVWKEIHPDPDASYSRVIELKLSGIVPMIALPHMPDNVVPVMEVAGTKINQVVIGSCTNSSLNDLGVASDILDGKVISEEISLGIAPGSRQVFKTAIEHKIMNRLVSSGARILGNACGPCIGMGFAPCSEGLTLRTFNRNFKGRSGTADASVYLVSPETAAASALKGEITDPRTIKGVKKKDYSHLVMIDDSMIIKPKKDSQPVEIKRGPNIKPCPVAKPLGNDLTARILIKTEDNITTDHIMPAGSKILPMRSNIPEISKHVFESLDPDFYKKAQAAGNGIIIGGENYGQGSSREHAAIAPMFLGIRAVIAKSFARIHKTNLINFGILPLTFKNPAHYNLIDTGDEITISGIRDKLSKREELTGQIKAKSIEISLQYDLSDRFLDMVLAGGLLNMGK